MTARAPAATATLLASERQVGAPARWLLLALGALAIWAAPGRPLVAQALPWGLLLFALWTALTTLLLYGVGAARGSLARAGIALAYTSELLFVSYLIGPSGGLASPFYLLYGLFALKAALYAPWLRGIWLAPFLSGPLYLGALGLHTGDLSFLLDRQFLIRYLLLFGWTLAAALAARTLGRHAAQTARLAQRLQQQADDLDQKTAVLTRTANDLGERVLELRSLQEIARVLASTLQLEETLQVIVGKLAELTRAPVCAIALTDGDGDRLVGALAAGAHRDTFRHFVLPLDVRDGPDTALVRQLKGGRAALIHPADAPPGSAIYRLAQLWQSDAPYLVTPLVVRGRLIGAIFLTGESAAGPSEHDRQLTANFAFFAATAIENARLYQTVWENSRELEAILQGIGDGVVVADQELRLLMMNGIATRFFGLESAPPGGVPLRLALPGDAFVTLLQETLDGHGNVIRELELPDEANPNAPRTYQVLASPLLSADARLRGVAAVLRDVTAQKDLERMKTNFLSVISHELRTPLHSIKGFVDIILMGKTGPVTALQQDFLGTVQQQTGHLQRLIDDLIEFSRMESGQVRLRIGPLSLAQIAVQVTSKLTPLAESAKLTLANTVPPELPALVGDGMRLEQVLTNLVENAIKFTPEGGTVTIGGADTGDEVRVWVQDTGIGIPAGQLEKVFDRFYQVDGGVNRLYRGTGLGLTICRHIIAHHKGRIWAESDGHSGSTFTVALPKTMPTPDETMDFTTLPKVESAKRDE